MIRIFLTILSCLLSVHIHAQPYWQQEVNTKIAVTLDDRAHFLHGHETFAYTNHSPDTLHYLYIHLWPNAYSSDRTAFSEQKVIHRDPKFYFSREKDRGYIDSLQFTIDGHPAEYTVASGAPDIVRLDLPRPLMPGKQIQVSTPFRVKIPAVFSRLGHTGRAYFISQWFPKPAVYDRKGWHPIPYLDQGEFYSEVGSYDVSITLPGNYIVMATGNCTDASENDWLDSLSRAALPHDTLYAKGTPASSAEMKTLHFHEDNIHDFAWFADKRWAVRKDTVTVPGNDHVITCYTAFLPQHQKQWIKGTEYLRQTVRHYSDYVGAYPYRTIKAVEGDMNAGGGMEYPTITVIDRSVANMLKSVVIHEAGHNWFYGILATNERDHAWMDEGINTFYEHKTVAALAEQMPDTVRGTGSVRIKVQASSNPEDIIYYQAVRSNTDQALEQTSANFTFLNYGGDVYLKAGLMMGWLEQYMGEPAFRAAMHEYFDTWKFRHPYPDDLKAILQKHTEKSIDWFFSGALHTDKKIDFKIKSVHDADGRLDVTLRNKSAIPAPAGLALLRKDSVVATAWSEPFTGVAKVTFPLTGQEEWTALRVVRQIPDSRRQDNSYRRYALFHKGGLKLRPFAGLNLNGRENIWALPATGYNSYDGFHAGLLFHNLSIPESRFKFALAPLYSVGSKTLTGAGSAGYSFYPGKWFRDIMLQVDARSFHFDKTSTNVPGPLYARYTKLAPSLQFTLRERTLLSPVTRRLTLKGFVIYEDRFSFTLDAADSLYKPAVATGRNVYGLLRYLHRNDRLFNPFSYTAEAQMGKDFVKLSAEGTLRIDYNLKNKALHLRGFAGKFVSVNGNPAATQRYWLNSTYTGVNDYLYEGTYFGRSEREGFESKQVSIHEGGLKVPTHLYSAPIGRSDDWLISLNLQTDLPLKGIPLRLFFDVGTFADASRTNPSGNKLLYDGGIALVLPFDILSVYVPLVVSRDFKDYQKSMYGNRQFTNSIVFKLQLEHINWLRGPGRLLGLIAR